MVKLISIDDVTVVKNISEEEYEESKDFIEETVNSLICELLEVKCFVDIDDRTLVRVVQDGNDLVVSIDDMYFCRYYKKRIIKDWF